MLCQHVGIPALCSQLTNDRSQLKAVLHLRRRLCTPLTPCRGSEMLSGQRHWTSGSQYAKRQVAIARSARHSDYIATSKDPWKPAEVKDRPNLEADVRYRRVDNSAELAAEARHSFAAGLAAGEAGMQLAKQALLIAAEDDAIASSSVVQFPVEAFMARIQHLAADTAAAVAAAASTAQPEGDSSCHSISSSAQQWSSIRSLPPQHVVAAVECALFGAQQQRAGQAPQKPEPAWCTNIQSAGFKAPAFGRSNLPKQTLLDHPGVWEDARLAYLNEVLVRKTGTPAALAILYCEVYRQLLLLGAVDFAVTFDFGDFSAVPVAKALPNLTLEQVLVQTQHGDSDSSSSSSCCTPRNQAVVDAGQLLNTCSSEALCELLRHLKRAYWPFPWDTNIDCWESGGRGSSGGFRAAAKAALNSDEVSAALRAVSATAAHRLQRGIWTSPGAGDLNRCIAAAERLVMMVGDEQPQERRDLAVLLLHAGQPEAAAAELSAYLDSVKTMSRQTRLQHNPFDVRLAQDLWKMLADSGVKAARDIMSVETVLKRRDHGPDGVQQQPAANSVIQPLPLTW